MRPRKVVGDWRFWTAVDVVALVALFAAAIATPPSSAHAAPTVIARSFTSSAPAVVASPSASAVASTSSSTTPANPQFASCSLLSASDINADFQQATVTGSTGSTVGTGTSDLCAYITSPGDNPNITTVVVTYICNTNSADGQTVNQGWSTFQTNGTLLPDSAPSAQYYDDMRPGGSLFLVAGALVNSCLLEVGAPTNMTHTAADDETLHGLAQALRTAYTNALATKPTPIGQ